MEMDPEVPELVVPELNTSTPLTPFSPAFAVLIVIAPLVLDTPDPESTSIAPPVSVWLMPALMVIRPPVPLSPSPTVRLMAPLLPPVAVPDPMQIAPVPPLLDDPELKTRVPLTPFAPALAERMTMPPLLVAKPMPLRSETVPPV
jgi:hypothetical protein